MHGHPRPYNPATGNIERDSSISWEEKGGWRIKSRFEERDASKEKTSFIQVRFFGWEDRREDAYVIEEVRASA